MIIVPSILLKQWKNEIEKHSKKNVNRVYTYHGIKEKKKFKEEIEISNVVITTYGTVSNEFSDSSRSIEEKPLYN